MNINQKNLGLLLIVLSLFLLVVLSLVKINLDEQGAFLCEVVAENPDLTMDDCPAHEQNSSWIILLAFAINFVILLNGIYLFSSKRDKKEQEKAAKIQQAVDLSKLEEDEKKIFKLIQEKNGSMYQSDIVKETELGKVKVTRILDGLEHKHNLVERKRRGMTNIVILKKKG